MIWQFSFFFFFFFFRFIFAECLLCPGLGDTSENKDFFFFFSWLKLIVNEYTIREVVESSEEWRATVLIGWECLWGGIWAETRKEEQVQVEGITSAKALLHSLPTETIAIDSGSACFLCDILYWHWLKYSLTGSFHWGCCLEKQAFAFHDTIFSLVPPLVFRLLNYYFNSLNLLINTLALYVSYYYCFSAEEIEVNYFLKFISIRKTGIQCLSLFSVWHVLPLTKSSCFPQK
jgi:hypothetical protein